MDLNLEEKQYLDLLKDIVDKGTFQDDRTGVGTKALFGGQMRFDLKKSFPLLTTKRVFWKGVAIELLWLLGGDTNIKFLLDNNVHIWDEWADDRGNLGSVYGAQWRGFSATGTRARILDIEGNEHSGTVIDGTRVDQIKEVLHSLKHNPYSRRHIVNAWNPLQLSQMALPPCHMTFQFFVDAEKNLSCQLYQRSCDMFLGVPFNIASYSLLTHILADCLGYGVGDFVWTGGNMHVYSNHIEQVRLQLGREPKPFPQLKIVGHHEFPWEYKFEDFVIEGYDPHPTIKAPIAV